jgi:hypothetical protein
MRKYCGRETIDLEILTDMHVFSTLEYEQIGFRMRSLCLCVYMCVYVCMYGWMCTSVAPERLDRFHVLHLGVHPP